MHRKLLASGINLIRYKSMAPIRTGVPLMNIVQKLEEFAPKALSEKWDNTGVLIEPYTSKPIIRILLTNDLTEDVMEEAIAKKSELIISYHPPIFSGLKTITNGSWKERLVSRCLENRIAVYSPHTSWDSVRNGVNDWLANSLPNHAREFITEGAIPETGQGRICKLFTPTPLSDIIKSVKQRTNLENIQLALARGRTVSSEISSVALCAGSGGSLLKGVKADLFLTGEMSHHEILEAVHCGTSVILTNHSNSERGFLIEFSDKLEIMLDYKVDVKISEKDHDPLKTM